MDRAQELQAMPFGERRMYARSLGVEVSGKNVKDLIVAIIQEEEMRKTKKEVVIEVVSTLESQPSNNGIVDGGDISMEKAPGDIQSKAAKAESKGYLGDRVEELEKRNKELEQEIITFSEKAEKVMTFLSERVGGLEDTISRVYGLEEEVKDIFRHLAEIGAEIGWTTKFSKEDIAFAEEVMKEESKTVSESSTDNVGNEGAIEDTVENKYPSIKVIQDMRLADLKKVAQSIAEDMQESIPASVQTKKQFLEYVIFGLSKLQESE